MAGGRPSTKVRSVFWRLPIGRTSVNAVEVSAFVHECRAGIVAVAASNAAVWRTTLSSRSPGGMAIKPANVSLSPGKLEKRP